MVEQSELHYEKLLYDRSAGALKVHGILAIIFGALGMLVALLFTFMVTLGTFADEEYDPTNSAFGLLFVSVLIFIFWMLPHMYLIISGSYLVRQPAPRVARTLVIINLVVGVFYNLVILIAAIINLTQITDYERSYHIYKKK